MTDRNLIEKLFKSLGYKQYPSHKGETLFQKRIFKPWPEAGSSQSEGYLIFYLYFYSQTNQFSIEVEGDLGDPDGSIVRRLKWFGTDISESQIRKIEKEYQDLWFKIFGLPHLRTESFEGGM